ncbi:MAG: apolipoprotein N-acyltransferase [Nitrospirota bacterium]|nr:apolipoprotein N-acyltransferase [Nitrospirota bacterium]
MVRSMSGAPALQIILACFTGLLYPLCFPDFDFGVIAWVVLLPLHLALDQVPPRRAFWIGWLAGFVAFVGTMFWVVTAMHLYGKLPLALSYLFMALLAAYLGLYVAVYALALTWLRNTLPSLAFIGAPFLWVTLELGRTYLLSGLPWDLIGYSQYRWLPAIQIADHTGVYGVSFVVVLVNAALAEVTLRGLSRFRGQLGRQVSSAPFPWLTPAGAALGLAYTLLYGMTTLNSGSEGDPSRTLRIGLVQANIDQAHKWDAAFLRETLDRYERLTTRAAEGVDLIIWPEAATPFLFEQETPYRAEVLELVRAHRLPLLLGSPALRYFPDGRPYLLNSAYLLSPDGEVLGRYDKRHLVPFGEYIPLRPVLFFLDKLVEGIGDFKAGNSPTVLAFPDRSGSQPNDRQTRFGLAICYEVIFPHLVRESVNGGAEFMVTITNDAWFGNSVAPYQHFGMVVLRAVENRIAFARSANTGISGFIDPYGRILSATPIFEELFVTGRIPIGRKLTIYTEYGDVFAYTCVIITALLLLTARSWLRREARGKGRTGGRDNRSEHRGTRHA